MPGRFYPGVGPYHGKTVSYTGYQPDRASIARLAVGPEMREAVADIVGEAIFYAQLIAPNDTSDYQSSFFTDVEIAPDRPGRVRDEPMARWCGRVVNNDRSAIYIEVGAKDAEGYRVMRKTLEWIESVYG